MIVHDLKNPLSVVMGGLDFLTDEGLSGDAAEALADAQSAARRISLLLANLVDVAKLEANRFQLRRKRITLEALLAPVLNPRRRLAQARDIRLTSSFDPKAQVDVDVDLVTRVVENLLDNGLRYTPSGGQLDVNACTDPGREAIYIGNSGPPVPPEKRSLIFEKFGQTTPGSGRMNLGLGLYFCRLVAEAHGGRIHVEETAELPTVFVMTLPC
jgi:signal transduction histidine kinase